MALDAIGLLRAERENLPHNKPLKLPAASFSQTYRLGPTRIAVGSRAAAA
jgi:hypothetical protein